MPHSVAPRDIIDALIIHIKLKNLGIHHNLMLDGREIYGAGTFVKDLISVRGRTLTPTYFLIKSLNIILETTLSSTTCIRREEFFLHTFYKQINQVNQPHKSTKSKSLARQHFYSTSYLLHIHKCTAFMRNFLVFSPR